MLESFKKLCWNEGTPLILHTDNGLEFSNSLLDNFCKEKNILFVHGRPRHPQSQGQVERFNQTICRKLSKTLYEKEKNWLDVLQELVYAYNLSIHRATSRTPFCSFRNRDGFNSVTVSRFYFVFYFV